MITARLHGIGPVLVALALLTLWEIAYLAVGDIALRSPGQTVRFAAELLTRSTFWPHLLETGKAFVAALALAALLGLGIGLVLGLGKRTGDVFEPMLIALYSIPKVTLYPILLLSFGLGLSAKIAFGALHGFIRYRVNADNLGFPRFEQAAGRLCHVKEAKVIQFIEAGQQGLRALISAAAFSQ